MRKFWNIYIHKHFFRDSGLKYILWRYKTTAWTELINTPCPSCELLHCYAKTLNIWCYETVIPMNNTTLPLYLGRGSYGQCFRWQIPVWLLLHKYKRTVRKVQKPFHITVGLPCLFKEISKIRKSSEGRSSLDSLIEWRFRRCSSLFRIWNVLE